MSNTYDNTVDARVNPAYDDELETDDAVVYDANNVPTGDAEKGATLGGIGSAVVGAVAGSAAGPVGAVAGAIIGGVAGAVASGAAVGAIDRIDNDNTISGVGTTDTVYDNTGYATPTAGNGVPGIQTGGYDVDGTPDSRGIMEKTADALTGDNIDDKKGEPVADGSWRNDVRNDIRADYDATTSVGNGIPGVQTGGYANDGTPDTRGIMEKTADAITGDTVDDKTGKVVNHP